MKPILKWVGGKTQLLNVIKLNMPDEYNEYYEPFIGGGALLFNLMPEECHVNDMNSELINVYNQIKNKPEKLVHFLDDHQKRHCKEYFYQVRSVDRNIEEYKKVSDVEKAARFIYLNKTCYNGLYRVNKNNEFNAPFGQYKNPRICNKELIYEVSDYFKNKHVYFNNRDFEGFLKLPQKGDFVYLDPPYYPLSDTSSFTAYQGNGFDEAEQVRLKKVCDELNARGVKFMLSNSDADFINELYKNYTVIKVKAKRNINSKGTRRAAINEVLVMNY